MFWVLSKTDCILLSLMFNVLFIGVVDKNAKQRRQGYGVLPRQQLASIVTATIQVNRASLEL
jgi:hypothetical protein